MNNSISTGLASILVYILGAALGFFGISRFIFGAPGDYTTVEALSAFAITVASAFLLNWVLFLIYPVGVQARSVVAMNTNPDQERVNAIIRQVFQVLGVLISFTALKDTITPENLISIQEVILGAVGVIFSAIAVIGQIRSPEPGELGAQSRGQGSITKAIGAYFKAA